LICIDYIEISTNKGNELVARSCVTLEGEVMVGGASDVAIYECSSETISNLVASSVVGRQVVILFSA
jgi:hypothetical protein